MNATDSITMTAWIRRRKTKASMFVGAKNSCYQSKPHAEHGAYLDETGVSTAKAKGSARPFDT